MPLYAILYVIICFVPLYAAQNTLIFEYFAQSQYLQIWLATSWFVSCCSEHSSSLAWYIVTYHTGTFGSQPTHIILMQFSPCQFQICTGSEPVFCFPGWRQLMTRTGQEFLKQILCHPKFPWWLSTCASKHCMVAGPYLKQRYQSSLLLPLLMEFAERTISQVQSLYVYIMALYASI